MKTICAMRAHQALVTFPTHASRDEGGTFQAAIQGQRPRVIDAQPGAPGTRHLVHRDQCRETDESPDCHPEGARQTGVSRALAPDHTESDLTSSSLHALLEERGIVPTEAFGTLVAAGATSQDASRLGIEVGAPMLVERRRIDDQHGTRIESTETRYVGSEYVFDVHLRRPDER